MFSKRKQLGGRAEGGPARSPLLQPLLHLTPPLTPLMRPLLGNACGRLLHSWRAPPRNGFKGVLEWGCGLQSLGSSSPSSDPRLPVSKAIWGCLKESDLGVTWASLLLEELPPDGNLGLVSSKVLAAWLARCLQALGCVCMCARARAHVCHVDMCACMCNVSVARYVCIHVCVCMYMCTHVYVCACTMCIALGRQSLDEKCHWII